MGNVSKRERNCAGEMHAGRRNGLYAISEINVGQRPGFRHPGRAARVGGTVSTVEHNFARGARGARSHHHQDV